MSITEQGLVFLLLYSLHSKSCCSWAPPWGTGEASAAFPPRTLESWAPLHRYHIFTRAAWKYNFNLVRASRSQVPPEPGNSRVSPESALQILASPSGQTQNLLNKWGALTG